MTPASLTGADLHFFLVYILGIEEDACPHCAGRMHTLSLAIDGGLKAKVNERTWSPPLGKVQEVR
jgi:hypothetical protein